MNVWDYYQTVLLPANVAGAAMRSAGIYVDAQRAEQTIAAMDQQLAKLERYVEGEAAKRGVQLKYSEKHAIAPPKLAHFLFTAPRGLQLEATVLTAKKGDPSTADEVLKNYASLSHPRKGDSPIVRAILKIRSVSHARSAYLLACLKSRRSDGCCHPIANWAKVRTARLSLEDPPMHQIPEHADLDVAQAVKAIFVPRVKPARSSEEWDPRRHGSFWRWDVSGAEAVIRMAVLTHRFCRTRPLTLWEYLRARKDIHARTAALLHDVPEGTYTKGQYERDVEAKQVNFGLLYLGGPGTIRNTLWKRARQRVTIERARLYYDKFYAGAPELIELGELDKQALGERTRAMAKFGKFGYCEDGFGRRRAIPLPPGVRYLGVRNGYTRWRVPESPEIRAKLDNCFSTMANSPTQSMCASVVLWMLALCYLGEYVPLAVPPMWAAGDGVHFPEARRWRIDGESVKAWHSNSVHDSGWGDSAPGELERTAKVLWRRCQAVPWDWLLEADVPLRIELKCGPDGATLYDYNTVAKRFGLEPLPIR